MADNQVQPMQPAQQQMTPEQQMMMQQNMQMQQQMMQMQQQMNQMQEVVAYEPLDKKLMRLEDGVFIKQKFDIMEMMTGCEFPNVYYAYARKGTEKKKGKKEFKYKEKSSFYDRCLQGSCKPYKMKVYNEQKVEDDKICMRCKKDCKCVFYCFNREEMDCWYTEGEEEHYLGKAYDPWDCMNFGYELRDESGATEFRVKASCCQCYFWIKCPCKMCNVVRFEIKDNESNKVGDIVRTGRDCLKNLILDNDGDTFTVDFPKGSNWRQRAMLMNLVVFIDFSMFEDTSGQGQGQGAH